jgi:pimeloyl-ACP methyl ester carboxylesterase
VNDEKIQLRDYGNSELATLVYLPGLHGDWTLVSSFRAVITEHVRFIEFAYPCRTDWTLNDYADAVIAELTARQITCAWLLAESFGSQVAWKILERSGTGFVPRGLVLAGGFVKHPITPGVHLLHMLHRAMPWWTFQLLLKTYARYARFRHRQAPETLASVSEFVQRRTQADRAAIASRYPLIAAADLREFAMQNTLPVFALSGFFDPIVPWPLVHPWLRKHCGGFRERRVIFNADHNVLGTAPGKAADQIMAWIRGTTPTSARS